MLVFSVALLMLLKAFRSNSLVMSLISMEVVSFLILLGTSVSSLQYSQFSGVSPTIFMVVILILEGVMGLAIMTSTAFPKTEAGVSVLAPAKW
uniref:NADH dehydrogenase subunit 4L n=1 Tax=Bovicola bovis TaxID=160097 RepID=A0A386B2F4_9NEOP|nr:NADH dehydrogenase subunit 4L [Bovicola bovis]